MFFKFAKTRQKPFLSSKKMLQSYSSLLSAVRADDRLVFAVKRPRLRVIHELRNRIHPRGSPMMIARSVPIACVSCVCGCGDSTFRSLSIRTPPYTKPIICMTEQTLHQHHCTTETGRRQDKMHCSRCRFMQKKNCCCQVRKSALYYRHRCNRCKRISRVSACALSAGYTGS